MRRVFGVICILITILLFSSCNSENKQVKTALEEMTSTPIHLNLDKMEARRNPLTKLDGKYKMVVYVDSSECTPCALSHLRFWNPLVKEAHDKKISIDYVFVLAPKKADMEDVNLEMEVTDLPVSVYIDTAFVFRNSNPKLPKDKKFHSFLLDTNNEVLFVGSPLDSEKLKNMYNHIIGVE